MLNQVSRILIGDGTTTGTSLATITAGDLLVLNKANTALAPGDTPSTSADHKVIKIAQGVSTGYPRYSPDIDVKTIESYLIEPYQAPVQKVVDMVPQSDFAPSAATQSAEYQLLIKLNSDQPIMPGRDDKSVVSVTVPGTATPAQVVAALVAEAQKNEFFKKYFTVAVSGANIRITGLAVPANTIDVYQYVDFTASVGKFEEGSRQGWITKHPIEVATETVVTPFTHGHGTSQQVYDDEVSLWGYEGVMNRTCFPIILPALNTVAGAQYDVISIVHAVKNEGTHFQKGFAKVVTKIAVPTGSAQATAVLAILNPYMEAAGV